MKRALIASIVATAVAIMLAPAAASADTYGFSNNTEITVPDQGQASPYPSTIHVEGVRAPVVNVEVGLIGVTHARPKDLDILLVPPDGRGVVLMSDTCGANAVTNFTWLFRADDFFLPNMGDSCGGLLYKQTNLAGEPDVFPGSTAVTTAYAMNGWINRRAMNGDWKLYVVDDAAGAAGKIAHGWTLTITTGPVAALVPATGTVGAADQYPLTHTVGVPTDHVIEDVSVELSRVAADSTSDFNLLLEGPQGQTVMLMSGACGGSSLDHAFQLFEERAPAQLPIDASQGECPVSGKPSDYRPTATMPAPAPPRPYGTSLSVFDGTSPNGEWKLYASDGANGGQGYIGAFKVDVHTRPKATVEAAPASVTVPEGGARNVILTRSASGNLGPADVTVTTTPGTAEAGADFTPIRQAVHFDRGEAEKTVTLDAIADGVAEPDETYTVTLSDPTGDARLGDQSQVDVTIQASPGNSKPGPPPPPTPRCDGKPATIVGTAGKDVLRGTRGADVIAALGGNDTVTAVKGNDTVCGGAGKDVLSGGAGRDRLLGGPGNDRLTGGAGRDTCLGGRGRNRVSCERKAAR